MPGLQQPGHLTCVGSLATGLLGPSSDSGAKFLGPVSFTSSTQPIFPLISIGVDFPRRLTASVVERRSSQAT
jgi:hypothetical protein